MVALKRFLGGFVVMVAVATTADAAEPIVARLETAVAEPTRIVAGGALFSCEQTRCVAPARTNQTLTVKTCRQLAKRVGVIAEFGDSREKLQPEKLMACRPSR
ncbi:MAG: hypothetical protein AB1760_01745 [Pseudomonadota bacterium]